MDGWMDKRGRWFVVVVCCETEWSVQSRGMWFLSNVVVHRVGAYGVAWCNVLGVCQYLTFQKEKSFICTRFAFLMSSKLYFSHNFIVLGLPIIPVRAASPKDSEKRVVGRAPESSSIQYHTVYTYFMICDETLIGSGVCDAAVS